MKEIIKKIEGLGGKVFLVTLKATYLLVKGLVGFIKAVSFPILFSGIVAGVSFSLYFTGKHFFQKFKGEYEATQSLSPELYSLMKTRGLDGKRSDVQKQAEEYCLLNHMDTRAELKCREDKLKELLSK